MKRNQPYRVPEMPRLEGEALGLYDKHFGQSRYQHYNGCRTDKLCKLEELPADCMHQPCHDVESYFWVIAMFLLQAIPEEDVAGVDDSLGVYQKRMQMLEAAAADPLDGSGIRDIFVMDMDDADGYRKTLHPGLAKFAPLIAELSNQISPAPSGSSYHPNLILTIFTRLSAASY